MSIHNTFKMFLGQVAQYRLLVLPFTATIMHYIYIVEMYKYSGRQFTTVSTNLQDKCGVGVTNE